jgi:hypothetical protein
MVVQKNAGRCRLVGIKLRQERRQNLAVLRFFIVRGIEYTRAVIAVGAKEKHLNGRTAGIAMQGDDIGIPDARYVDILPRLNAGQHADAVAQPCGAFEIQRIAGGLHIGGQFMLNLLALALQEIDRIGDLFRIILLRNLAYARRRTALDMILQARPRAVGEKSIRAIAQQKAALQKDQRLIHCARRSKRSEVPAFAVFGATMFCKLRKIVVACQ